MPEKCPVCRSEAKKENYDENSRLHRFDCIRCGIYEIEHIELIELSNKDFNKLALSHWIRTQNEKGYKPDLSNQIYTKEFFESLKLPNPAVQADNLILYLGHAAVTHSKPVSTDYNYRLKLCAVMGGSDLEDYKYIIEHLYNARLVELDVDYLDAVDTNMDIEYRLTFEGWQKYEELKKGHSDSKQVFMAMKFCKDENDPTEILYKKFLKEAVDLTGLKLRRLDEMAKAGIIDNNMRVEIRKSCLLLSELTHDNSGAYFEAGFAEGMNIPVIYLCEKEKFDEHKTHFDTNHCTTIIWEKGKETEAMEKLKATIRLSVPDKVKMED